jgi:PAS domain S-box-containing protein
VAFFAGQSLTSRLAIVTENAFRLARALPLNRPISGDDEIAQLDHMFHAMAESVAESTSKERAVIANAVDVICSIGAQGRFTAVNPASLAMLGYPCEELIGTDYIELIPSQDAAAASDCLEKAMQGAVAPPFETRVKRKNGTVIDVRWTVHWSARDKSLFCGLHDISERKAAERMKQEVLAMITHDLRTPLTTIRHVIEMADAGKIGSLNEEGERLCADADQSAVRILSLIDDLLGMERMRAGMMELNLATTTIASIFEQALHSVSGLAKERQVEIEMSPSDIRVHADRDRVIQVLVNLISNAIKFSPEQTTVAVSATSIGGMIEIRVVDQGRGIAAEKLDSVFERFQQVEKNDQAHFTSGSSSSGLGLAICKAIVLLHGGTIRVESKESEGSTFAFTLPASAP